MDFMGPSFEILVPFVCSGLCSFAVVLLYYTDDSISRYNVASMCRNILPILYSSLCNLPLSQISCTCYNTEKVIGRGKSIMPYSDAQKRATAKYNAKAYDRIEVKVAKGKKAEIKAYAESKGESVNGFINRVIDEAMSAKR